MSFDSNGGSTVFCSSAAYYGRHAAPAPPLPAPPSQQPRAVDIMECDEPAPAESRKRRAPHAAPSPDSLKRLRRRIYEIVDDANNEMQTVADRRPLVADNFIRATHNNPDISRCLMAYFL